MSTQFVICCPVCDLRGGPFADAEAEHHAGTHDLLLHGGQPTTLVQPSKWARTAAAQAWRIARLLVA
jgi:hypothetical protein